MNYILTVGEIYDKAIDLCLRNAWKISLAYGIVTLMSVSLVALGDPSGSDELLKRMHLRPHGAAASIWWLTDTAYLVYFLVTPVASAALFVIFDSALRGDHIGVTEAFRLPIRRLLNVVVASLLSGVYTVAPGFVIFLACIFAFAKIREPAIIIALGLAALGIGMWITGLLSIGAMMGFARVALDGGRVAASLRRGTSLAFSKVNRRRAFGVGVPLILLLALGSYGGVYAGGAAFGLSGMEATNVIVQSFVDLWSWSLIIAVATVYYRNLTPAA